MKKILFLLIVYQMLTGVLSAQNAAPKFILPIKEISDDFYDTYYSEGKEYKCEEWLETYMQLYHSNRSNEIQLIPPSEKYSIIKENSQATGEAKFIFEIYQTEVFKENTPSSVVETLMEDENETYHNMESYLVPQQLLITGIMLPHNFEIGDQIPISVFDNDLVFNIVERIEFLSSRNTGSFSGFTNLLGYLNGSNNQTYINSKELEYLEVRVVLQNGENFKFKYSHTYCHADPVDLDPDIIPVKPPTSNPPVIPELDENCNFLPSYFNNPLDGNPYNAKFPFSDLSTSYWKEYYTIMGYEFNSQSNTYMPVWGTTQVLVPDPYTTNVNKAVFNKYGRVNTTVFLNPYHENVKNPIIVTDGIDFLSNRKWRDIVDHMGGNDMISLLWDGGYDVIIADFEGGADFIQRNSFALIELIRSMLHDQGVDEIEAIIGPSMGGQIVRHALLYWEQNLLANPEYGEHKIKTFISADSPWTGANASLGVQAFAKFNKDKSTNLMVIDQSANAPAARQLLLNQVNGENTLSGITYNPAQHIFKTNFDNELNSMGSAPKLVGKILGIADGSGNGTSSNAAPGELLLGIEYETCNSWYLSECKFKTNIHAVESQSSLISKECETLFGLGISCQNACESFPNYFTSNTNKKYDSCPGSPFELSKYLEGLNEGLILYNSKGFKLKIKEILNNHNFTFIPSFSALGMPLNTANQNFSNTALSTPNGLILPGSPFDYVYFDEMDSEHNSFEETEQGGSLPFILTNINYEKKYDTKCLVMSDFGQQTYILNIEQGDNGGPDQTICLPFDMKFENYEFIPSECDLNVVVEDGQIIITSNLNNEWCGTSTQLCIETDCGPVCLNLDITTYPGGTRLSSTSNINQWNEEKISVFPNPNNGIFNIVDSKLKLELFNYLGEPIPFTLENNQVRIENLPDNHIIIANFVNPENNKPVASRKIVITKNR